MKVFWVLGYDNYYPGYDNFQASFETYEEAQVYAESQKAKEYELDEDEFIYERYKIIDVSDRL